MDPLTAFSLAAAIVQVVEVGAKLSKRLVDYIQAHAGDVPRPLENIATLLPLIIKSLSSIQEGTRIDELDDDTRVIVHGVVLGCLKLARELDDIANKITVAPGENVGVRVKKAFGSMKYEERIKDIDKGLQAYVQVLILHQVVNKTDIQMKSSGDKKYFEVKMRRIDKPVSRADLLSRLHETFHPIVQGHRQSPLYVFLQGAERVGKSHIALEYCHETYVLEHYRAVFWLDASTPDALSLSLENVAAVIRQSKSGTPKEKADFVNTFLSDRWHPWLLVLDDYNPQEFTEKPLGNYLPERGLGAIVVTSRATDVPELAPVIKVFKFLTEDEDKDFRSEVTTALGQQRLDLIIDAFGKGLDANSYSATWRHDKHQPFLNLAAELGFDDAVRLFLDLGASPKLSNYHGSALHRASYAGHASTLSIIFDYEESTSFISDDDDYGYAVRSALQEGHLNVLKAILARREARIDVQSRFIGEGLVSAVEKGHNECIRLLHSHNKTPITKRVSALSKAVMRGDEDMVRFFVSELKVDPNDLNDDSEPALNTAVYCRLPSEVDHGIREKMVMYLLENGADPNARDKRLGSTSVHMAAYEDSVESLNILLEHGGDPTIENENGQNALERAVECNSIMVLQTFGKYKDKDPRKQQLWHARALHTAAKTDSRELLLELFKEADINLTWGVDEDTPLLTAIKAGKLPAARMLVRNGAFQTPNKLGTVPLLRASEYGFDLLIKDLVKAEDSPGLEITDERGNTPLMLATKQRHEKTVKVLLGLGADPNAMNHFAETPTDLAEESEHKEIMKLFENM